MADYQRKSPAWQAGDVVSATDVERWEDGLDRAALADSGGLETVATNSTATGSVTVNLANGNVHALTLTGNVTTLTLSNATSGKSCAVTLRIKQDATGGRTFAWPAAVLWPGGAEPTVSAAANALDVYVLETIDGGTTWLGNTAGQAYS